MNRLSANELRRGFLSFFEERGHTIVPSASLIPHDPDLLFTVAGMVPFKPYFLGEEAPPFTRATTVQKCLRAGGKDSDLEEVGRDGSHLSFFEMLGNFSFGDYFKAEAIPMAWDMITNLFGLDPDQLWVTVHTSDDEAEQIWRDVVGIAPDRIQRLGKDNWWGPPGGPPGPCGPSSEIFVDKGPAYGDDGGPAHGSDARFLEIWNLVFMQFNRDTDEVDHELPRKNIDTGAGLERILGVLQGVDSVWEIDTIAPILDTAQSVAGVRIGTDPRHDVSLRILAEHARAVSFLVSDGVFPSNEGRGYVLRRIIRRLVRHAYLLGVETLATPDLVRSTVEVMGESYPDLVENQGTITDIVVREEERFRQTLKQGLTILDTELAALGTDATLPGTVAFALHDTHGFPLELTEEITAEQGIGVDRAGFDAAMATQRRMAKDARRTDGGGPDAEAFIGVLEQFGPTEFTGRQENESKGRVLAVIGDGDQVAIVLDRTPFYAESGGQVGDTGILRTETGVAQVLDTTSAIPGQLTRHVARVTEGEIAAGQEVTATIDVGRRDAIRRNHTATHLLHWALRDVVGDHVKQQGSYVDDERLRFDFSHYGALTPDEIVQIEDLVNADTLANHPARHYETTKDHATEIGAIAFFGDKYGDIVRVLEAGPHSTELCGGTHVSRLGDIGTVKIISEGSVGSNLRRLEAITGFAPIALLREDEARLAQLAGVLGVGTDELVDSVERQRAEVRDLQKQLKALKQQAAGSRSGELAATAVDGVVVARVDGGSRDELRALALAIRDQPGIRAVVLGGEPEGGGAALVAAATKDGGLDAGVLIDDAKASIKGGGKAKPDLAMAGGRDAAGIDTALDQARAAAGIGS